jgi:hypothetical protein
MVIHGHGSKEEIMSSSDVETRPVKKPRLSWRFYIALRLAACLAIEFGLMRIYGNVRFQYFQDPTFEYAPIATSFISTLSYVVLILLLVGVLALIFIPFRFQRFLHILILTWMSGGLIAIMVDAIPKAHQAVFRSMVKEPARPLVSAINRYVEKTGHPPETLDDLVPGFIRAIPGTGFVRFPEFAYEAKSLATKPESLWQLRFEYQEPEGDEFVLFYAGVDPKALRDERIASPYWERVTRREFDVRKQTP